MVGGPHHTFRRYTVSMVFFDVVLTAFLTASH